MERVGSRGELESEARLALARRLGVIFARVRSRPEMVIEAIDAGIAEVLGISAEVLCGDPRLLRALVHPDDRRRLDAAGASLEPEHFRLRCRGREGVAVEFEVVTEPEIGVDGTCAGFEAALQPVAAAEIAESYPIGEIDSPAELEITAWLELMSAATSVALFLVDSKLVFRRFTYIAAEGSARLRTDVLGLGVSEAFADFPGLHVVLRRALSGVPVREQMRIRGMTLELHCRPLVDSRGEIRGVLAAALDRTQEVSREDARRDQEAYFQSLIQTVNDGILVNDPDGMIEYANDRLAGLLGTTAAEMLGRRIFDYMDDESAAAARANLAKRRAGVEEDFDFRWCRRDGTAFWSLVAAKPFYDAAGNHRGSLVAVTDITRRKQAEDALRRAHDQLEERVVERTLALSAANAQLKTEIDERRRAEEQAIQANRTKSAFLASMSHELRTPLNAIIGYAELISDEMADAGEGTHLEDVDRIRSAANHLLELINDILDLSKIEAAKMEILMEPVELDQLLREIAATTRPLALKNDNRLGFRSAAEGATIISDRTKLKQILLNLIANACKFTRKGTIDVEVALGLADEIEVVTIAVADSGIGIAPDKLGAIFQAFTQADEKVSVTFGGTGLGLAISKRLAEMLGGDITVSSVVGEGTRFELVLPLPRGTAVAEEARANPEVPAVEEA